jgi:hypothetical protein
MEDRDHEAKLRDCLAYALPGTASETLLELLNRLDALDAEAVQSLLALISARPGAARPIRTPQ